MNAKRMPSTGTMGRMMGKALGEHARRYTYCLVDETHGVKIGSAVAIQMDDRFFLATAAHIIAHDAHAIKVLVHDQVALHVDTFLASYCDVRCDIGLLEISPSKACHFEFLPQDRLSESMEDETSPPVIVVGFPAQFCQIGPGMTLTTEDLLQLVLCGALTFHTQVLPPSTWPEEGLEDTNGILKPLIADRDMLLEFEPEQEVTPFTPQTVGLENRAIACPVLDPQGLSGGGIWLARVAEGKGGVTFPDPLLIGLQVSWYRAKNWLRGVRIGTWLNLVREKYPGLSETA